MSYDSISETILCLATERFTLWIPAPMILRLNDLNDFEFFQLYFIICNNFPTSKLKIGRSSQMCSIKKGVLKNFRKIHRKTPVLGSLF